MMKKPRKGTEIGSRIEGLAAEWLARTGVRIIARNFETRFGEIDIVALDGSSLVFVEVRYRRVDAYGGAAQSVTHSKQRKLSACASVYLRRCVRATPSCRFDVIAVSGSLDAPRFIWHKAAFEAPS